MNGRWVDRVRRAWALPRSQKAELVRIWCLLFRVEAALRRGAALPGLRARLAGKSRPRSFELMAPAVLARLVRGAARVHPLAPACLGQAVCLEAILSRRGVESELRIGVTRKDHGLTAHAWVEVDGIALGEDEKLLLEFVPLAASGAIASS